jgi:hypothetical protein
MDMQTPTERHLMLDASDLVWARWQAAAVSEQQILLPRSA